MKIWLSLGAMVVVAACAAGEDNTDVQVASETTLPRCNTEPPPNEVTAPPDPPNVDRPVNNRGERISSSSSSGGPGTSGSPGGGASNGQTSGGQSSGTTSGDPCPSASTGTGTDTGTGTGTGSDTGSNSSSSG